MKYLIKIRDLIYYQRKVIVGIMFIAVLLLLSLFFNKDYSTADSSTNELLLEENSEQLLNENVQVQDDNIVTVDIKGCIVKPGVYSVENNKRINDVGQGDSILIHHNNKNILLDTGGNVNSSSSIVQNITIPLLKSLGIRKLNYTIITHGDFDHMGEAINLVNNFKVDGVIFNNDEYNDLETKLISVLEKKGISYYKNVKELSIFDEKLYFLNTEIYDNENDNSNVVYTSINGNKLLFMGDAEVEKERDILDRYNLKDIDFLKVGHHGSDTSSSKEFINTINPKYSLISVGRNNRYGHPKDTILDNLSSSKIYRTDKNGSIWIGLNKSEHSVITHNS